MPKTDRKPKEPNFAPVFVMTPELTKALMRIEAAKQAVLNLPITPRVLANLRETARLFSTHYSTQIEGNRLTQQQVAQVIATNEHFAGREREEAEVKGYYAALDEVERLVKRRALITETDIQRLHALVMAGGRTRVKPTPYRDGQNVIRDSRSRHIVYMPPEAGDVPGLMRQMIAWINPDNKWPVPMQAAVAHYQYATIHPYYDGNGRTARLLTTLVMHLGGYDLKGLYALEEYYARNLAAYYEALNIGPSHNYYEGRAQSEITQWIAYFVEGTAYSFEKVRDESLAESRRGGSDQSKQLRDLDARQRKALALFEKSREITAKEIGALFGYKPRMAAILCQKWVEDGFLRITDPARKTRKYALADKYERIISDSE
jgi:Fic family protein